jgi:hypothetical protein
MIPPIGRQGKPLDVGPSPRGHTRRAGRRSIQAPIPRAGGRCFSALPCVNLVEVRGSQRGRISVRPLTETAAPENPGAFFATPRPGTGMPWPDLPYWAVVFPPIAGGLRDSATPPPSSWRGRASNSPLTSHLHLSRNFKHCSGTCRLARHSSRGPRFFS